MRLRVLRLDDAWWGAEVESDKLMQWAENREYRDDWRLKHDQSTHYAEEPIDWLRRELR